MTIRHFKDLNKMYEPKLICILETKNNDTLHDSIREKVGMGSAYYVNSRGTSEGLAFWWKYGVKVTTRTATHNITHCDVILSNQPNPSIRMWVYEDADPQKRRQNWNELRNNGRGSM